MTMTTPDERAIAALAAADHRFRLPETCFHDRDGIHGFAGERRDCHVQAEKRIAILRADPEAAAAVAAALLTEERLAAALAQTTIARYMDGIAWEQDVVTWAARDILTALRGCVVTAPAPGGVHDHGPEEGPAIACREHLIGACRLDAARTKEAAALTEVERLREVLDLIGHEADLRYAEGRYVNPEWLASLARAALGDTHEA